VLDTLVETAARLCNAEGSGIALRCGEICQYAALYATYGIEQYSAFLCQRTFTSGRETTIGRVALTGDVVHIADIATDQEYALPESSSIGKIRTNLGVPLLRDGTVMGMLTLFRQHVEPFTDRQIDLVKTFADQAVIAIEDTRLFEAKQASKRELQESLEYQTATSEVLNVINRSPSEVQPVFDFIARSASRLCGDEYAIVTRYDGQLVHLVAQHNPRPGAAEVASSYPLPADPRASVALGVDDDLVQRGQSHPSLRSCQFSYPLPFRGQVCKAQGPLPCFPSSGSLLAAPPIPRSGPGESSSPTSSVL